VRWHEAMAKGHSMRFLALALTTPAVFADIGFSNPAQVWAHVPQELPAGKPAPESLPTPDERSMGECPNGSQWRLRSEFVSRRPRPSQVPGLLPL
jgi:hypothetical protein